MHFHEDLTIAVIATNKTLPFLYLATQTIMAK